ncbi:hypothetical protein Pelo_426 [Pelomyxa schiedti]|nr:hypothetical protein Pelo_426 [Pelomyxa schiedti]
MCYVGHYKYPKPYPKSHFIQALNLAHNVLRNSCIDGCQAFLGKELPEEELGPMTSVIQSPLPSTSNVQPNEASNAVPQVPILSATIAHASESTQVLNSASLDKILLNMLPVTSQIVSNLSYLQKRGARYRCTVKHLPLVSSGTP